MLFIRLLNLKQVILTYSNHSQPFNLNVFHLERALRTEKIQTYPAKQGTIWLHVYYVFGLTRFDIKPRPSRPLCERFTTEPLLQFVCLFYELLTPV